MKNSFIRIVAGVLCLSLTSNAVFAGQVESGFWAERRQASRTGASAVSPAALLQELPAVSRLSPSPSFSASVAEGLPASFLRSHAALLAALPSDHGSVRKVSLPASAGEDVPVVIHVQDVHMNAEAQAHISAAVRTLVDGGHVELVALEGASGPVDVGRYRAYPDQAPVRGAADYLLREGRISGPVHAAFTAGRQVPFLGVDDAGRYEANADAYRRSAPRAAAMRSRLAARVARLSRRKAAAFSPRLKAFDARLRAHRVGSVPFGEHVASLARESAGPLPGAVADFVQALEVESSLDFALVERERAGLVERLAGALSPAQVKSLAEWSAAYRLGQARHADFYRRLRGLCAESGVSLASFPALDAYIRYVLLADRIDADALFRQARSLEKARLSLLAATPEEKALAAETDRLHLAGKLLDFSLTPDEWAEYDALGSPPLLDLSSFADFYREARARDHAMADNLLRTLQERPSSSAILVTGGYHAPGLTERLTGAGLAVVTFVPRLEKADAAKGSAYLDVFTREKTPLEKLFQGESLFLSPKQFPPETNGLAAAAVVALSELEDPARPFDVDGRAAETMRILTGRPEAARSSDEGAGKARVTVASEGAAVHMGFTQGKDGLQGPEMAVALSAAVLWTRARRGASAAFKKYGRYAALLAALGAGVFFATRGGRTPAPPAAPAPGELVLALPHDGRDGETERETAARRLLEADRGVPTLAVEQVEPFRGEAWASARTEHGLIRQAAAYIRAVSSQVANPALDDRTALNEMRKQARRTLEAMHRLDPSLPTGADDPLEAANDAVFRLLPERMARRGVMLQFFVHPMRDAGGRVTSLLADMYPWTIRSADPFPVSGETRMESLPRGIIRAGTPLSSFSPTLAVAPTGPRMAVDLWGRRLVAMDLQTRISRISVEDGDPLTASAVALHRRTETLYRTDGVYRRWSVFLEGLALWAVTLRERAAGRELTPSETDAARADGFLEVLNLAEPDARALVLNEMVNFALSPDHGAHRSSLAALDLLLAEVVSRPADFPSLALADLPEGSRRRAAAGRLDRLTPAQIQDAAASVRDRLGDLREEDLPGSAGHEGLYGESDLSRSLAEAKTWRAVKVAAAGLSLLAAVPFILLLRRRWRSAAFRRAIKDGPFTPKQRRRLAGLFLKGDRQVLLQAMEQYGRKAGADLFRSFFKPPAPAAAEPPPAPAPAPPPAPPVAPPSARAPPVPSSSAPPKRGVRMERILDYAVQRARAESVPDSLDAALEEIKGGLQGAPLKWAGQDYLLKMVGDNLFVYLLADDGAVQTVFLGTREEFLASGVSKKPLVLPSTYAAAERALRRQFRRTGAPPDRYEAWAREKMQRELVHHLDDLFWRRAFQRLKPGVGYQAWLVNSVTRRSPDLLMKRWTEVVFAPARENALFIFLPAWLLNALHGGGREMGIRVVKESIRSSVRRGSWLGIALASGVDATAAAAAYFFAPASWTAFAAGHWEAFGAVALLLSAALWAWPVLRSASLPQEEAHRQWNADNPLKPLTLGGAGSDAIVARAKALFERIGVGPGSHVVSVGPGFVNVFVEDAVAVPWEVLALRRGARVSVYEPDDEARESWAVFLDDELKPLLRVLPAAEAGFHSSDERETADVLLMMAVLSDPSINVRPRIFEKALLALKDGGHLVVGSYAGEAPVEELPLVSAAEGKGLLVRATDPVVSGPHRWLAYRVDKGPGPAAVREAMGGILADGLGEKSGFRVLLRALLKGYQAGEILKFFIMEMNPQSRRVFSRLAQASIRIAFTAERREEVLRRNVGAVEDVLIRHAQGFASSEQARGYRNEILRTLASAARRNPVFHGVLKEQSTEDDPRAPLAFEVLVHANQAFRVAPPPSPRTPPEVGPPGSPPGAGLPWADASEDALSGVSKGILAVVQSAVSGGKLSPDLTRLWSLAAKVRPDMEKVFPLSQLKRAPMQSSGAFLQSVLLDVLIPAGRMTIADAFEEGIRYSTAEIARETWTPSPYLGRTVWNADIRWRGPSPSPPGISVGPYAFTVRADQIQIDRFSALMRGEFQGSLSHLLLADDMKARGMTVDDFIQVLVREQVRHEERRHAEDSVFAALSLKKPYARLDHADIAFSLTKPSAYVFQEGEASEENPELARVLMELSGQTGGVIRDMRERLDRGEKDLAYAAFLYFLGNMVSIENQDDPWITPEHQEAAEGFMTRAYRLGMDDEEAVLAVTRAGPGHPAENALSLLEDIYAMDFWNDEERARLLKGTLSPEAKPAPFPRRTPPGLGDPGSPPRSRLAAAVPSEGSLSRLTKAMRESFHAMASGDDPSSSLARAWAAAESIREDMEEVFPLSRLRQASPQEVELFLQFLVQGVMIPGGRLFLANVLAGRTFIYDASILRKTLRPLAYLGRIIRTADVEWRESHPETMGFSVGPYAFTAASAARRDAEPMYREIMGPDARALPYSLQVLGQWMRRRGITAPEYGRLFGEERIRQEERRHAESHVFAGLLRGKPTVELTVTDTARAVLKPASLFSRHYGKVLGEESSAGARKLANAVVELEAQTGGLIRELESYLDAGEPETAFAAFLDFLGMLMIRREAIIESGDGAYGIVAKFFLSGAADLGFGSEEDLVDRLQAGPGLPAERALALVKGIYAMDFWNDEERARLLREGVGGSLVSPEASPWYYARAASLETRAFLGLLGAGSFWNLAGAATALSWAGPVLWLGHAAEPFLNAWRAARGASLPLRLARAAGAALRRLFRWEVLFVGLGTSLVSLLPLADLGNGLLFLAAVEVFARLHKAVNDVSIEAQILASLAQAGSGAGDRRRAEGLIKGILAHDRGLSHRLFSFGMPEGGPHNVAASYKARLASRNPLMRWAARRALSRALGEAGVPLDAGLLGRFVKGFDARGGLAASFGGGALTVFVPPSTPEDRLKALFALARIFDGDGLVLVAEARDAARIGRLGETAGVKVSVARVPDGAYRQDGGGGHRLVLPDGAAWEALSAGVPLQRTPIAVGAVHLAGVPTGNRLYDFKDAIRDLLEMLPLAGLRVETLTDLSVLAAVMISA